MAGLLTRPSVRLTVATSPSGVSRPYWAAITSYPSACSGGITLLKLEPSAHIPWQKTMLGLVVLISNLRFWFSFAGLRRLMRWPLAFLHHPRSDIGRGVQHRYSPRLARIQKVDGLNIHEVHFLHVQNASCSALVHFGLHLMHMLRS